MNKNIVDFDQWNALNGVLNEQESQYGSPHKTTYGFDITLGENLFSNGIDKINTDSNEFKTALYKLRKHKLTGNEKITVIGGASNVGTKNGYDNKALASRRANNFIKELKNAGIDTSRFIVKTVVGVANIKNSPEAKKEQFVKLSVKQESKEVLAKDTTAIKPINTNGKNFKNIGLIKVSSEDLNKAIFLLKKNGIKIIN